MKCITHPCYFPSISQYSVLVQANELIFEKEDNYQKQTNRNRMYISGPNGLQILNIPVKNSNQKHQKYKDILIDNDSDWQKNHLKSLETAYKSSSFYDLLIDEFDAVFKKNNTFLFDLNLKTIELVNECLGIEMDYNFTTEYFTDLENQVIDFRPLVNGKKDSNIIEPYMQVFQEKEGFLNNLSILDLLFNEGRAAVGYLKSQNIKTIF